MIHSNMLFREINLGKNHRQKQMLAEPTNPKWNNLEMKKRKRLLKEVRDEETRTISQISL